MLLGGEVANLFHLHLLLKKLIEKNVFTTIKPESKTGRTAIEFESGTPLNRQLNHFSIALWAENRALITKAKPAREKPLRKLTVRFMLKIFEC